jgi:hypothetical protein
LVELNFLAKRADRPTEARLVLFDHWAAPSWSGPVPPYRLSCTEWTTDRATGWASRTGRDTLRELVFAALRPLVEAQIANALDLKYLVVRDRTSGKFLRVGALRASTSIDEELIEVWEKDPNVQSYADLMNRVLGKPTESVELTGQDGRPLEIRWQGAETKNFDRPVRV